MSEPIKRTIRVLKEDITDGKRIDSESCMVARAAMRDLDFLEEGWKAYVDGVTIEIEDKKGRCRFVANLKEADQDRITDFDAGKAVEPFTIKATFWPSGETDGHSNYDPYES